jgi:hypothetical protein
MMHGHVSVRSRRIGAFLLVLPLLVLLIGHLLLPGQISALDRELAEYSRKGYLADAYQSLVWHVAQPFVWHSDRERVMSVNGPRAPGGLNIYVLEKDPAHYFPALRCECRTVQPGDTILCDQALLDYIRGLLNEPADGPFRREFLETWIKGRQQLGYTTTAADRAAGLAAYESLATAYAQSLLRWVIGHEIGHVRLDHLGAGGTGRSQDEMESAADSFVVDTLAEVGTGDDLLHFALTLESLIVTLYGAASRAQHPGGTPVSGALLPSALPPITVAPGHGHPPWLLRMVSMWSRIGDRPGFGYIRDLAPGLRAKMTIDRGGADLTPCGSHPAVYLAHALVILKEPVASVDYVSALIDRALVDADMQLYSRSEDVLDEAVTTAEQTPTSDRRRTDAVAAAYRWRGTIRYIRGDYRRGLQDLSVVARLLPARTDVQVLYGWCRYSLGDLAGADRTWQGVLQQDTRNADAHAGLALVELGRGQLRRSVEEYGAALDLDSGYAHDQWLRFSRFWPDPALAALHRVRAAAALR